MLGEPSGKWDVIVHKGYILLRQLSGSWRRGVCVCVCVIVSKPRIRRAKPSQPSMQSHLFQPHRVLVSPRHSSRKVEG